MKRKAIISVVLCIVLTVAVITVFFCVTKLNDNELFRSRIDGLMPIEKVTLYEGDYYRQTEETDVIQDILEVVYSNIGNKKDQGSVSRTLVLSYLYLLITSLIPMYFSR